MATPTENPDRPGKGQALDASAKSNASTDKAGQAELPCQKPWTLHVTAVTRDKSKGKGSVEIKAGKRSSAAPFWVKKQYTETLGTVFTDRGSETFELTASSDEWMVEKPTTVTLNNGDDKFEMLVLEPRPWIGFTFVSEKTGKDVADVKLSLKLPRKGEIEQTYSKDVLKIAGLDPGTGEVKKALHTEVWSAEKVEEV